MVLITLAELTIRATWWTVKGAYSVGRYLIYGKEKTEEEKNQEKIEELAKQLKEVQEQLNERNAK